MKPLNFKSIFLRLWPFLFITTFVFIFHYEAITTKDSIYFTPDPWGGDITKEHYPILHMYYNDNQKYQNALPLWKANLLCGYPTFHGTIKRCFHPIFSLLFNIMTLDRAFNVFIVSSFWLGAIGVYVLARYYNLNPSVSVLSGIIYSHSGFMVERIRFFTAPHVLCTFPWIVLCIEKYFEQRKTSWLLGAGIISGTQWLLGYSPYPYVFIIGISFIIFYRHLQNSKYLLDRRLLFSLALVPLISIGLAAILIMPLLELIKFTIRSGGISFDYAMQWHYPWKHLITLTLPFYYGDIANASSNFSGGILFIENCAYVGVIPLSLALVAIILGWRNNNIRLFNLLFILSLLLVLGTPLYKFAWYTIPGLHYLRKPMIFLPLTVLSLALLAGFGLMRIVEFFHTKYTRWVLTIFILVVTSIDLYSFGFDRNLLYPSKNWCGAPNSIKAFNGNRTTFRIYTYPEGWAHLYTYIYWKHKGWRNLDLFLPVREFLPHGGEFLWGYNSVSGGYAGELSYKKHSQIMQMFGVNHSSNGVILSATASKWLTVMSVKYVVCPWDINNPLWKLVYKKPTASYLPEVRIYENVNFLPRAYVVGKVRIAPSSFLFSNMVNDAWDPLKEVWLEQEKPGEEFPVPDSKSSDSKITWAKASDERVELFADMKAPGYLVLTDTWYPGWHASINGKPVRIYKANYVFRALWIDKQGFHKIVFWYDPVSFKIGLVISLATLGILGVYFLMVALNYLRKPDKY